jgi:hypothetical protein
MPIRPPPPALPGFAAAVFLDDDADVEPHHRPDVGDERAFGAQDQHLLVAGGERGADLHHAGVERAGEGVDLAQGVELHGECRIGHRVGLGVELGVGARRPVGQRAAAIAHRKARGFTARRSAASEISVEWA